MLTINLIEQEIIRDLIKNPGDTFYENVLSDFLDEQNIEHDFRKPLHNNLITELKPYQEKCLAIWANYWINISVCTRPTDENKAEQYFYNLYKELSFPIPKKIIWFNNPIEMYDQVYSTGCQLINKVYCRFWNQVNKQLWNCMLGNVKNQIINQLYNQMWSDVNNKILGWGQLD
jgi:hypothetical protein